jgi:hypothetical protein
MMTKDISKGLCLQIISLLMYLGQLMLGMMSLFLHDFITENNLVVTPKFASSSTAV